MQRAIAQAALNRGSALKDEALAQTISSDPPSCPAPTARTSHSLLYPVSPSLCHSNIEANRSTKFTYPGR